MAETMQEVARDYTPYIAAVYLIALVVYSGCILVWQRQVRKTEALLKEAESGHGSS